MAFAKIFLLAFTVEVGKLFEEKIKGQKSLATVTLKFKVMGYFFFKQNEVYFIS